MAIRINGDNTAAAPGITANDDTNTGVHFGTDEVNIVTGGTQQVKVDSSGRLLVGTSTARANFLNGTVTGLSQVEGSGSGTSRGTLSVINNATAEYPATLLLGRSNDNAVGSNTLSSNGDWCGRIGFMGNDGSEFVELASISGFVDGDSGANDMPGRLSFRVTENGSSSPIERLRISNNGRFHTSGVTQYFDRGQTSGNSSFTRDFTLGSSQTCIVMMGFSHYGHVNNYGCCRIDFAATGNAFTPDNVHNMASGSGGSWSISKPNSSTIRVSKNAGSYSGSGGWFIHLVAS